MSLRTDPPKWRYWGRWNQSVLSTSLWHASLTSRSFIDMGIVIQGDIKMLHGDFYFLQSDFDLGARQIAQQGDEFFAKYFAMCDEKTERMLSLDTDAVNFVHALGDYFGCNMVVLFADSILESRIRALCSTLEISADEILLSLKPARSTLLMQYQSELRNLQEPDIDEFVAKWRWVGTHAFEGEPLTRERVIAAKNEKRSSDPETPVFESDDRELNNLISIACSLIYYRSNLIEVADRMQFVYRQKLTDFGATHNCTYEDVISMTHSELTALAQGGTVPGDVSKRKREFGYVAIDGQVRIVLGEELKNEMALHAKKTIQQDSVTGRPAFRGIARGIARIVREREDLARIQEGDILIANETLPDYIMAMHKAAAFVTNKGGITSHAALIARELKKPCVTATENATDVFTDGDMVEVDADNGIVRKL